MAGYVVEYARKACIAKQTKDGDFPDKNVANRAFTHRLAELLRLSGLEDHLSTDEKWLNLPEDYWTEVVVKWSERSRYLIFAADEAETRSTDMVNGAQEVLKCIRNYW